VGYGYSGDEFWQTFELQTPGWVFQGSRSWLRDRYQSFHETYGGAAPSGPWANQFSIICWPITHAILPRDLQRQLARILYELRHSFSAELFESPTTLGEFVASRSWNATSRFRNLAEEPQLIGQIAAALLLQGDFGTSTLIHPAALRRISNDLEQERMARGWLQTARHVAQERATVRGFSFVRDKLSNLPEPHEARAEIAALGIEPRLILRPRDTAKTEWDVSLEIPDLSQLLVRFPNARDVLTQSRCTVTGSTGRPLPREACLYGSKRVTLSRWPRHDEVLLQFDKRDPQLEALLRTECLIRPGPSWLFRVASDGLAYEVRNLRVRSGQRYVLIRESGGIKADVPTAEITCQGVDAWLLALPEVIDSRWETALQQLGLKQSKSIEVWPAGLTPAQWDNDGHGEWLASERPCLGIRADHSVSAIIVTISSGLHPPLVLDNTQPGTVSFIELPRLHVGLHTIRFATRSVRSTALDAVGDLEVLMRIRESRPWSQGGGPQGPLLACIDPVNPTLEQLWEAKADIAFQGPAGRQLRCTASLIDSVTGDIKTKTLPALPLPVEAVTWATHFSRHFRDEKAIARAYDTSKACDLRFVADELGTLTLHCERESVPLRWVLHHKGGGYGLRLLDDSGVSAPAQIYRRSFERPNIEEVLAPTERYDVPPSGGIYIARRSGEVATIVAPPMVQGLDQFGCDPYVHYPEDLNLALPLAWKDAELWGMAKLSGHVFSMTRRKQVLLALERYVIWRLCGDDWMTTEGQYHDGSTTLSYLQRAVWKARHEAEVADRLRQHYAALVSADMLSRIRELVWAAQFLEGSAFQLHDSVVEWFAEFALRVASDPAEVRHWAGARLAEGVDYLIRFPTFIRAARFVVVATDRELNPNGSARELYASWRWK
jgi:hypothetical protein